MGQGRQLQPQLPVLQTGVAGVQGWQRHSRACSSCLRRLTFRQPACQGVLLLVLMGLLAAQLQKVSAGRRRLTL